MPPSSLLASLGHPDLSPASTPSPPTPRNDLDGKEKQKVLRQARKLSQILGELQATVAPTRPVRGSTPAALEVPPTDPSQLHVPSSSGSSFTEPSPRFSPMAHTVVANTMSPSSSLLPSVHDDSNRTVPRRRSSIIRAHINQLDLTRFGFGRRDWSGSMRASSTHSDENASHTDRRPLVAETQSNLSDLHSLENVHVTRPRNKPRWRSVYNLNSMEFGAHPRSSEDSPMPSCSSKRGVSLWTKRRASNEGQRCPLADQGREGIASGMPPPLTESQRVLSIRRGRKLTQVFGTEPPIALYKAPSRAEDAPTSDAIQRERTKTYLALSSGDLRSANSQLSLRHRSHSSLSSADSIFPPSPHPTMNDVEIECDPTSPRPLSGPDEDPEAQCSHDPSEDGDAFRRRRLRAAKLSRFFGVTYNDLTGPIGMAVQGRQDNVEEVTSPQAQAAEVGVRIDGPGWFWNRTDSNHGSEGAQDADTMNAAIALLRQMPRA
ncbi:hypothetical protein EDB85DRAFT_209209 [Lactarius pseudohatsudake]|nr:hypothetical protein EDB85DRAFT_209209 [Lactarius pseudohatsudake]